MALDTFNPYLFVSAGEQSNKFLTPTYADGIAQFQAQRAQELTGLTVRIEPIQPGTGDPSPENIRPISGRTGLTVTAVGKNLLENNWGGLSRTQNGLSITIGNDGIITVNGTATAGGVIIANFGVANSSTANQNWRRRALPNGTYRFVGTGGGFNLQVRGTNEEAGNADTPIAASNVSNTFTIDDTYKYNWIRFQFSNGATGTNKKLAFMIVPIGMTYDTYVPYTAAKSTITWESIAGTVYGGTLDVVSGVLTVDWDYIESYNGETLPGEWISDRDVYEEGTTPTTGAEVAYKLAEPVTYQLDPEQVMTVPGFNQVYSDAGPVIDIKF